MSAPPPPPPKPSFKIRLKLNPQIQAAIKSDASLPAPPPPPPPPPPAPSAPPSAPRSFASFPPPPPRISIIKIPTPSSATSTPIRLVKSTFPSRAPSPAPPPPPPVASGSGTSSTPLESTTPTVGTPGASAEFTDGSSSMPGTPMSGIMEGTPGPGGKKVKPPKKPRIGADGKPMVSGRLRVPLKEVCEKMIKEVRKRDDYAFFIETVTDDDVPGYSDIIKEPMSLTQMEEKVADGQYKDFDSFEHDLLLIFTNCKTFNPPETMFHQMANKLQTWVIRHLPTNRALVLPPPPAPPSPSPAPSPSPSIKSAPRSPSVEVQSPATFTAEGVRIVGTGSNQLGKKRGPYKKSQNAVMTAAPVVVQEVMGSTDDAGKLRGTSLVEFEDGCCHLVKWWETRGRRLKTKKEVAKLTTHPDFVHTLTDSSFNLAELESLYPTLNAFVLRPATAPGLIPLPDNFLAAPIPSTASLLNPKAFAAAAAAAASNRPLPPPPSSTPLNPSYGNLANETQLAPAFSWRRSRPTPTPAPTSNAAPPPPRSFVPVYNPDPYAYYAIDSNPTTEGIIVPPSDPYRSATAIDFGSFPLLHSSAAAPQAHDQASQISFLQAPFPDAPTFFDPLLETQPSSLLLNNRTAAVRAWRAEATLREAMYGSHVGEAYAASLERFMREAIGEEGGKSEATKEWIEENVVQGVYGAGGFMIGRAVGEAWERRVMDGEEEEEEEEEEEDEELGEGAEEQKPMAGVEDVAMAGEEDVTMSAKLEPGTEDATIPPPSTPTPAASHPSLSSANLPNPKLINRLATRTIRSLPSRHQQTTHHAAIRSVPISLPLLLHRPEDFTTPIPPPAPSSSLSAKRKRSLSTSNAAPEPEAAYGSPDWVNGVLKTIGKELGELIREQEEKNGGGAGGGARSTRAAKAKEVGGPAGEVGEDERMRRVRLLLLSLAKFVPSQELEKLNEQQLELFPAGPVRNRFASLLVKD
ncbi:hypothetical protein BDY24DRAFT_417890 [Mrakia frigida]|uniref:bromodomain-containing protein n=1 Tax=Mrakia frigida TaxID=29902 RepID=UPI003FCBF38D